MSSSAAAGAGGGDGASGPLCFFSGETEDSQEYKRWKVWVMNKLLTLDKLPKNARGAYVYTLLAGKALECVEHLDPSDYQKEGGDRILLELLDQRFPQKDKTDEMGETLGLIFGLRPTDGETVKSWVARATELFDRCERKTQVTFPEEARGWIILHRTPLSEEQKAVVLARAQGDLRRSAISTALRSCYPDMVLKQKKVFPAHVVEPTEEENVEHLLDADLPEAEFSDVELLLSEHVSGGCDGSSSEAFLESEVAEVLASTWKEKRAELSRLQKTRKFTAAKDVKRSFRIEVEELKKRTKCHRCGRLGHWSRECKAPRNDSKGPGKGTGGSSSSPPTGAASVEPSKVEFIAFVSSTMTLLQRARALQQDRAAQSAGAITACVEEPQSSLPEEVLLVSSPGYGVLDSGCGKTIIGSETLRSFEKLWSQRGVAPPCKQAEVNQFRFGNGQVETSDHSIAMPVVIAGKRGVLNASVVSGRAPLLISRPAMQALRASIDFENHEMQLFQEKVRVPLHTNAAGQFVLNVMDEERPRPMEFQEVMLTESEKLPVDDQPIRPPDDPVSPPVIDQTQDCDNLHGNGGEKSKVIPELPPLNVWIREDWGIKCAPLRSSRGPSWPSVQRRVVRCGQSRKVLLDEIINHKTSKDKYSTLIPDGVRHVITEFHYSGPEISIHPDEVLTLDAISPHERRSIAKQVKHVPVSPNDRKKLMVVEVFSPPRFSTVCEQEGFRARNVDILTGEDLSVPQNRKDLEQSLHDDPPELLILCPPCTDEGGWFHLNSTRWDRLKYLQRVAQSRSHIRFCLKLFRQQVDRGRRALFEHPTGAKTWHYPEMKTLCRRFHTTKLHMCQYGLKLHSQDSFLRKSTRLLVSHEDMTSLGKLCPGESANHGHSTVAGSDPQVGPISRFAGKYTTQFVRAVLQTIPAFRNHSHEILLTESHSHKMEQECLVSSKEVQEDKPDAELRPIIARLHKNLGHPSNSDLVRILKHGQASEQALRLARDHHCDFCKSNAKPHTALPSQVHRIPEFNYQVGIDVKHLTGWKLNQKITALNIVDTASGYQRMIPFFEPETSKLLWEMLDKYWCSWAGNPKEIVLDPKATNLGEPLVIPLEKRGTHIRPIAAEAHFQLGKTESHGGWFNPVLEKILKEHSPQSQAEWLECVQHAHVKNNLIQNHGVTPSQYVFGKNPDVPSDLLSSPLSIIGATASLTDESLQKAQRIRTTARHAVIELQDDRALRSALAARPRFSEQISPGSLVCYWRNQKWIQGKLQQGGQWYGTAVVLGNVGRNYIIIHRKTVLRVAPEQIRLATGEEKTLRALPQAELLGIKDLIEGGALKSQQYVDLASQDYPMSSQDGRPVDVDSSSDSAVQPTDMPASQTTPVVMPTSQPDNPSESRVEAPESEPGSSVVMPPLSNSPTDTGIKNTMPYPTERKSEAIAPEESYGPVRRKVLGKSDAAAMWRPPALQQEDFIDIMREVVPRLIEEMPADEPMSSTSKRTLETSPSELEPSTSRLRTASPASEILSAELISGPIDIEVLIADYLQKKLEKELPHSNNEEQLQKMIDSGKVAEWKTLIEKPNVLKIHYGKAAKTILAEASHRFIGSRFVITRKASEEGQEINPHDASTFLCKARWCLQGHLDPDLELKAAEGKLQSPTLNQLSRTTLMQIIASFGWDLQLGDIKGAFLEAGMLDERFRPLYAHQPPGGIPGLPKEAVIEVLGNVYGQNDAPASWFATFRQTALEAGWMQSTLDSCLFLLRCPSTNRLEGIMGVHVDDTALGGSGDRFEKAVAALKTRFPYRKWRINNGEFCGAFYTQCPRSKRIVMSMQQFAHSMKSVNIPKGSSSDQLLESHQIKLLRGVNGSLNWLATQSRPDLAAQTSMSQQAFPNPKIHHLRQASNVVRRARMHGNLPITFVPISPEELTLVCHSDAAFANVGVHTQAGFIIGFTSRNLNDGESAPWVPATWKSYKLPRAVSSTLAAESQAMSTASGTVEWVSLLLSEIIDGPFKDMRLCKSALTRRPPILVTDCKSLYDHLMSPSAPTSIEDRRTSIDVVIIRDSIRSMSGSLRWVPTNRMLADALTKDQGDPLDLLRACMKSASYQISPEDDVLEKQAQERLERVTRKADPVSN